MASAKSFKKPRFLALAVIAAAALGWAIYGHLSNGSPGGQGRQGPKPAPVSVAPVQRGSIDLSRTFSGTLEATAKFVLAPKVDGRIKKLSVDIADIVERGQVVAELDDDEFIQARAQASADMEVAKANLFKAEKALEIANRELKRVATLRKRGVASDSQYDEAKANQLSNQAQFQVAKAQLARAQAAVETANIRLSYTRVTADWPGGDASRVVAERFVDEGETVKANAPLLSIVELNPITGVVFAPEKDYAFLKPGQAVTLGTDAFPGRSFQGRIDRIAPIFKEATRQARVEMTIPNPRQQLKPGMFIRATVVLKKIADAVTVPDQAITERNDQVGVFLVNEKGSSAVWRRVEVGVRQGKRVQVLGEGLSGRVIVLGQQLVHDGSPITIPGDKRHAPSPKAAEAGK